jgi:apolipoprotein N-acyltransferase
MTASQTHHPIAEARRQPGLTSILGHIIPVVVGLLALMLAFPRPGWSFLAHFALLPILIVAVKSARPRLMTAIVYIGFSVFWLWMIRWLGQVTQGGYIGLSFVMAIYATLAFLSVRAIYRRTHKLLVLLFPICWVTWEFLRGYWPSGGFGWLSLAHTQAAWLPDQHPGYLAQSADLFGEYTVSFLVVMTTGLLADLLLQPLKIKPTTDSPNQKPTPNRWVLSSLAIWAFTLSAALAYGHWRISTTPDHLASHGLNVAIIQTNEPVNNKDLKSADAIELSWREMVALSKASTENPLKPDLIAWPESAVPASLNPESIAFYETFTRGTFVERLSYVLQTTRLARTLDTPILAGAPAVLSWELKEFPDGKLRVMQSNRFNSAYYVSPQKGILPEYYSKMHRVPFGEYIPWVDSSPWLKDLFIKHLAPWGYDFTIRPGPHPHVFIVPSKNPADTYPYRVVTPICFEDSVARATHQLIWAPGGNKQADMIVNLTNDGWYPDTDQCLQHFQIASLRSIENRVPSARAVNTGMSGFIDSTGKVTRIVQKDGKLQSISGFDVATLRPDNRSTLWGIVGVTPVLILFFFVLAALALDWSLKTLVYWKLRKTAKALQSANKEKSGTKSLDVGNSPPSP